MALRKEAYHREIIKNIANELLLDRRVVDYVATHPYLITSRTIRDQDELTPIMHRYFGKFAIYAGNKKKKLNQINNKKD